MKIQRKIVKNLQLDNSELVVNLEKYEKQFSLLNQ